VKTKIFAVNAPPRSGTLWLNPIRGFRFFAHLLPPAGVPGLFTFDPFGIIKWQFSFILDLLNGAAFIKDGNGIHRSRRAFTLNCWKRIAVGIIIEWVFKPPFGVYAITTKYISTTDFPCGSDENPANFLKKKVRLRFTLHRSFDSFKGKYRKIPRRQIYYET